MVIENDETSSQLLSDIKGNLKGSNRHSQADTKKYGIIPQTVVHWVEKDGGIMMVPDLEDPIESARGMFKRSGLLDKLLETKRVERMLANGKHGRSK